MAIRLHQREAGNAPRVLGSEWTSWTPEQVRPQASSQHRPGPVRSVKRARGGSDPADSVRLTFMQLVDVGRSGKPVMCVAMGMVRGLESHPRLRFRGRPGVLSIPVRRAASSASFVSTTHRGVGVQASAGLAFGAVMAGRGSGRSRWPGEGRSCRRPGRRRCRRGSYGRFAVPRRGGRALRSDAGCRRGRRSPAHRRRTG